MKYEPHKSSLFDLDANIAALLIYLIPFLVGFITDSLSAIIWILPLLAFIFEKESEFVLFHAANALTFFIIKAIIFFLTLFMSFSTALTASVLTFEFIRFIFVALVFIFLIINFIIFIITIISMIKAYNYQDINIPGLNKITHFILNLKR